MPASPCRWAAGLCALSVVFWHGAARTGTAVVVIVFAVAVIAGIL
jgi:uncharacterized membrane protein YbhN (UPF0104 family)